MQEQHLAHHAHLWFRITTWRGNTQGDIVKTRTVRCKHVVTCGDAIPFVLPAARNIAGFVFVLCDGGVQSALNGHDAVHIFGGHLPGYVG